MEPFAVMPLKGMASSLASMSRERFSNSAVRDAGACAKVQVASIEVISTVWVMSRFMIGVYLASGGTARSGRGKISRACLDGQRRLRGHLDGDRVPPSRRHALRRIAQHVALAELVEDLRERSNRRVAEAGTVRIAAGARRALTDKIHRTRVARRAPRPDGVRVEVAAV